MEAESPPRRRIGRPPSFDRDAALRAAMLAFWRHGYEGTSLAELTAAMGISPPSLYAAFGDKRALFLEAVRLYAGDAAGQDAAVAAAPSARAAAADRALLGWPERPRVRARRGGRRWRSP